ARVLQEEVWLHGDSPLWSALGAAMDSLAAERGRRVVLVLTDNVGFGMSPIERALQARVERRATDDAFLIYAVGFLGGGLNEPLARLAAQTGGGHFVVPTDADLPD